MDESDRFEAMLRDPLGVLLEEIDEVEDDWNIFTQFVNHHIPIKKSWGSARTGSSASGAKMRA